MAEAKTNQYTNLQGALQKPQKVTLSEAYIADAFKSYGFEPTAADMHYWTTVPESKKNKLQTELRERKQNEESTISGMEERTVGPNHLTDEEIISLYSKYGLDEPDLDWVRSNMPDDPKMLENILKYQRKFLDEQAKIEGKATIDQYKQSITPQKQQNSQMMGQGGMPDGAGGYPDGQGGVMQAATVPHFVGPDALIKFDEDPNGAQEGGASTVWYVDPVNKILRPFMSQAAFDTSYDDPKTANAAIVRVKKSDLNGILKGYQLLDHNYGITEGGTMKPYESTSSLKERYGKPADVAGFTYAVSQLKSFTDMMKAPGSGITPSFVDQIQGDVATMAKFANALAFGEYSLPDIYKDIKRLDLVKQGRAELANQKIIDPNVVKSSFIKTPEAGAGTTNPEFNPPAMLGGVDSKLFEGLVTNMSPLATKALAAKFNPEDPQFKADMAAIPSAYHDILLQKLEATTEGDKAAADYNYQEFKDEIERKYNVKLSNNAIEAWSQIQGLQSTLSERGLSGSGIENEQLDNYIANIRRQADQDRIQKGKDLKEGELQNLAKFASNAEIQRTIAEDKAKGLPRDQWRATQAGLVPDQDTINSVDMNVLKAKYPKSTEEELRKLRSQVIDDSGAEPVLRSSLYKKKFEDDYQTKYGNLMTVDPNNSKENTQAELLRQQRLDEDKEKARLFALTKSEEGASLFDTYGNQIDKDGNIIKTKEAIAAEEAAKETAKESDKPVDTTDYSSLGQKITDETQLGKFGAELKAMGIPLGDYGKYIKKDPNNPNSLALYYTKPNVQNKIDQKLSGTQLLNSNQLTNARLALEKSGISSNQFTKYITGGGGSTSYFNAPTKQATNIFNELNKGSLGTPAKPSATSTTGGLKAAISAASSLSKPKPSSTSTSGGLKSAISAASSLSSPTKSTGSIGSAISSLTGSRPAASSTPTSSGLKSAVSSAAKAATPSRSTGGLGAAISASRSSSSSKK